MNWWMWAILGFVLLVAEMLTPGTFYLMFLGISALIVAAAVAIGMPYDPWYQVFVFAISSILLTSLARRPLMHRLRLTQADRAAVDDLIGEIVTLREPLAPGQSGDAELRGTTWKARNSGTTPLAKGGRYKVSGVDGLTVVVTGDVHGKGAQQ